MKRYDQLSPAVKSALLPGPQRAAVDRVNTVIKDMTKAGVLQAGGDTSPYVGAYLLMGALLHASPKALLTIAAASSKTEQLSKMLTNQSVIDYVSGVNKIPATLTTKTFNALANTLRTMPAEE